MSEIYEDVDCFHLSRQEAMATSSVLGNESLFSIEQEDMGSTLRSLATRMLHEVTQTFQAQISSK
jgi:hypothetical protein